MSYTKSNLLVVTMAVAGLFAASAPASAATGPSVTELAQRAVDVATTSDIDTVAAGGTVSLAGVIVTARDEANSATAETIGGVAVMTVLRDGETSATFEVSGGVPVTKTSDGRIILGDDTFYLAISDKPWAVDANGKQLGTSYEVDGSRIVQRVDTKGATFPVVADPSFKLCDWYTKLCVKTSRTETRRLNDAAIAGLGAFTATFCGLIPWSPWYVGALKAVCAGVVAAYYIAMRDTIKRAQREGRCVEFKFTLPSPILVGWKVVDC